MRRADMSGAREPESVTMSNAIRVATAHEPGTG